MLEPANDSTGYGELLCYIQVHWTRAQQPPFTNPGAVPKEEKKGSACLLLLLQNEEKNPGIAASSHAWLSKQPACQIAACFLQT